MIAMRVIDTLPRGEQPTRSQPVGRWLACIAWFMGACVTQVVGQHQTETFSPVHPGGALPYRLTVRPYDMGGADLPTLHSFAAAEWDGKWILLAGRTNGMHSFEMSGQANFPADAQNREVWVIDPVGRQVWSRSLEGAGLTAEQVASLTPTNNQFLQRGERLYMSGGYGARAGGGFTTFSELTALDLPGLMDWTIHGVGQVGDHIRQLDNPLFRVTGGAMHELEGRVQLVFGQDFQGGYSPGRNGDYTRQIRSFEIVDDGTTLSVANVAMTSPVAEYRRRDLNVIPILKPGADGTPDESLVALAGVFTESFGTWTVPVEVDAAGSPTMADPSAAGTFKQAMNQYHSAKLGLYSESLGEMHELLLGGISLHTMDDATQTLVRDDNMPFTSQITSVVRGPEGDYRQHYLGAFPDLRDLEGNRLLFGANAEFFLAEGVETFANGVIDLDVLTSEQVVGYVYGGIVSNAPHTRDNPDAISGASDRIFEIVITPQANCDFDGDGTCGLADLNQLLATGNLLDGLPVTSSDQDLFDLNGDGRLDQRDLDQWLARAGANGPSTAPYLRGDANLDGAVDIVDFELWQAGTFTSAGVWEEGDFNGDGVTDVSDFNLWNENRHFPSGSTVPEAESLWLMAGCLSLLTGFLRRRLPARIPSSVSTAYDPLSGRR